jgi:hypothetical protein
MKKSLYVKTTISLFVCAFLCVLPVVSVSHADMINQLYVGIDDDPNWGDSKVWHNFGTYTYNGSTVVLDPTLIDVTNSSANYNSSGYIMWICEGSSPISVNVSFDYQHDPFNASIEFYYSSGTYLLLESSAGHFSKNLLVQPGEHFYISNEVGYYGNFEGHSIVNNISVSTSPVPLPGAVLLLGAGLCRLAAYARRRKE